jgi:aryl-alcohol dehydrogenase-like predicted oxidoreductase
MKYQRVGRTGLQVSIICLGTNNFGRGVDEAQSVAFVRKAY